MGICSLPLTLGVQANGLERFLFHTKPHQVSNTFQYFNFTRNFELKTHALHKKMAQTKFQQHIVV